MKQRLRRVAINLNNEQYGNTTYFDIKTYQCPHNTVACPNNNKKCVSNPIDCIEPTNNCMKTNPAKPFSCNVNKVQSCVKSQIECDCPDGKVKCVLTGACVDNEDYCPFNMPIDCANLYPQTPYFCPDGICRKNAQTCYSMRACPIGFTLCPDLSCRKDLSQCSKINLCDKSSIKCLDQSCVKDQKDCPNLVTCPKQGQLVCPDGSCVDNEVNCKPLQVCNAPNSILCPNNTCVSKIENCPKSISCGHSKALCDDLVCRETCIKQSALRYLVR
jgi:hypothetical protein